MACSLGNVRCGGGAFAWAAAKSGSSSGTAAKCEHSYRPVMGSSNSAWQPTQPLHHLVQCVLVDEVGGWSFDAAVQGLISRAQLCPNYGSLHHVYSEG